MSEIPDFGWEKDCPKNDSKECTDCQNARAFIIKLKNHLKELDSFLDSVNNVLEKKCENNLY